MTRLSPETLAKLDPAEREAAIDAGARAIAFHIQGFGGAKTLAHYSSKELEEGNRERAEVVLEAALPLISGYHAAPDREMLAEWLENKIDCPFPTGTKLLWLNLADALIAALPGMVKK